jgi:hypothetical protein
MATTVRFNTVEMRRLTDHVDNMIHRVSDRIADDMRRAVPVDTGVLRSTIKARHFRLKSKIWVGTDYWAHVEYGTRPHEIRSHGNYPLRNPRTGQVFSRRVWHPGTQAQPYIRPSVYRVRDPR